MKNIAIFGASRSGKSTLSKMIAKKYPSYHIMMGDSIRLAFATVLPQNDINSKHGKGMEEDFPKFLSHLFYGNIKRNEGYFNYIIETCDILPEQAIQLFGREDTIIIFMGYPEQTIEEHFKEIKKYQTDKDWTYERLDKELNKHSSYWTMKSKEFQLKCKELGIWFVDTSKNREKVLQDVMKELEINYF